MVKYVKYWLPILAGLLAAFPLSVLDDGAVSGMEWLAVLTAMVTAYAGAVTPTKTDRESTDGTG